MLVNTFIIFISFWIGLETSADISDYTGGENKIMFDLLPTLPLVYLIMEFPFNMIPLDWPMLIFVQLLFSVYILCNFLAVTITESSDNIYGIFNWYYHPYKSIGYLIACYAVNTIIFAGFWALANKWKLPNYSYRTERRYTKMEEIIDSHVSVSEPLARSSINREERIQVFGSTDRAQRPSVGSTKDFHRSEGTER